MRIAIPYQCDVCKTLKTEESGGDWLIGITTQSALKKLVSFTGRSIENFILVIPWTDFVASTDVHDQPDVAHLCSVKCADDWTLRTMTKMHSRVEEERLQAEQDQRDWEARLAKTRAELEAKDAVPVVDAEYAEVPAATPKDEEPL